MEKHNRIIIHCGWLVLKAMVCRFYHLCRAICPGCVTQIDVSYPPTPLSSIINHIFSLRKISPKTESASETTKSDETQPNQQFNQSENERRVHRKQHVSVILHPSWWSDIELMDNTIDSKWMDEWVDNKYNFCLDGQWELNRDAEQLSVHCVVTVRISRFVKLTS